MLLLRVRLGLFIKDLADRFRVSPPSALFVELGLCS